MHLYRPVFRPPGYATLPHGVHWDYVEVPLNLAHAHPDLPVSAYTYGIISTDRALTAQECATFDLAIFDLSEAAYRAGVALGNDILRQRRDQKK